MRITIGHYHGFYTARTTVYGIGFCGVSPMPGTELDAVNDLEGKLRDAGVRVTRPHELEYCDTGIGDGITTPPLAMRPSDDPFLRNAVTIPLH